MSTVSIPTILLRAKCGFFWLPFKTSKPQLAIRLSLEGEVFKKTFVYK